MTMQFRSRRTFGAVSVVVGLIFLLLVGVAVAQYAQTTQPVTHVAADFDFYRPPADQTPLPMIEQINVKNIILMIGDGMGPAQVTAARILGAGPDGRLHMDRLPVTGAMTTHSANALVTCSAAAATALATGQKTNNGMLSLLPDGTPLRTILEAARDEKNMATGLVTVCTPAHATPAAFAAHVSSRGHHAEIAKQILDARLNVLFASIGLAEPPTEGEVSERRAALWLAENAPSDGCQLATRRQQLAALNADRVVGLFRLEEPQFRDVEPTLAEMTQKAIQLLARDPDGFFLMVEGSQIDWACHAGDGPDAVRQTLLFDQAVQVAADFALTHQDTLVVVTADHETGGMVIAGGDRSGQSLTLKWPDKPAVGSLSHSGVTVPIYAFGPEAIRFTGLHDNADLPRLFASLLDIDQLQRAPVAQPATP